MKSERKRFPYLILAGAMLITSIIFLGTVTGTMAKYTSTATGSDSNNAAKWSFIVGDAALDQTETEIATASAATFHFGMFDYEWDTADYAAEEDVDLDYDNGPLAPGTMGGYVLKLNNNSEVNAEYSLAFEATYDNLPDGVTSIPLEYTTEYYETATEADWTSDISDLNLTDQSILMDGDALDRDVYQTTIYWRWSYEPDTTGLTAEEAAAAIADRDLIDTKLGIAAAQAVDAESLPTVTITANLTVTQVD